MRLVPVATDGWPRGISPQNFRESLSDQLQKIIWSLKSPSYLMLRRFFLHVLATRNRLTSPAERIFPRFTGFSFATPLCFSLLIFYLSGLSAAILGFLMWCPMKWQTHSFFSATKQSIHHHVSTRCSARPDAQHSSKDL